MFRNVEIAMILAKNNNALLDIPNRMVIDWKHWDDLVISIDGVCLCFSFSFHIALYMELWLFCNSTLYLASILLDLEM